MERSYTNGRNYYGVLTHSAGSSFGDGVANDIYTKICASRDWPFLEQARTFYSQANVQSYPLAYDTDRVLSVAVLIGSLTYTPTEIKDFEMWQRTNLVKYTSDYPRYWNILGNQIRIWPIPATTGNLVTITNKVKAVQLSRPDYTAGSVQTVFNGAQTITFQGTTLTTAMIGRYIQITMDDSVTSGDNIWYQITGVPDAVHANIATPYGGASIVAATQGYTIGQMPYIPAAFHELPWLGAAVRYWMKENDKRATTLKAEYVEGYTALMGSYDSTSGDMVLDYGEDAEILNPNLTINITNQTSN